MYYHLLDKKMMSYFRTNDGTHWPYYTKKEFKMLGDHSFCICGELRKDSEKSNYNYWLVKDERTRIQLFEYHLKNKWYEKTVGYIPVKEDNENDGVNSSYFIKIVDRSYIKIFLYPVFYLLVALFIFWGISWYINKEAIPKVDQSAVVYDLNGLINEQPDKIMLPGITTINLQEKSTNVQQMLPNPKGNQCYFQYQVILDSTKEILYKSDLIPPGKMITQFHLTRELSVGEHQGTVRILTRDLKNPKITFNTGEVMITLNVQKTSE